MSAGVENRIREGERRGVKANERYYEILKETLEAVFHGQAEALETAARKLAGSLRSGGMLYTFGTGHGHLLALEVFYRAGGLARVCPILDERLMLHLSASESTRWERADGLADELLARYPVKAGDVLLVISNSGRNTVPVELAMKCRARGAYVIALTSRRHTLAVTPRNPMGKRLFEVADLVLDNGGTLGDAAVEGTGGRRVGPASTAVGSALLQAIVCRVEEIAREEGWDVEFFASSNIDGGDEINAGLIEKYRGVVRGL